MGRQTQWLFEVPVALGTGREGDRHVNLDYFGNPEVAVTPVSEIPKEGSFYQIKKGDALLRIARKAYGVDPGPELRKLARLINDDPYNLRFRRPEPVDLFPEGIISFYPEFVCGFAAQSQSADKPPSGSCYAIIQIPARRSEPIPPHICQQSPEFVKWVQASLNKIFQTRLPIAEASSSFARSRFPISQVRLPITGILSLADRNAIQAFQRSVGLPRTGIVDPPTQQAMYVAGASPSPCEDDLGITAACLREAANRILLEHVIQKLRGSSSEGGLYYQLNIPDRVVLGTPAQPKNASWRSWEYPKRYTEAIGGGWYIGDRWIDFWRGPNWRKGVPLVFQLIQALRFDENINLLFDQWKNLLKTTGGKNTDISLALVTAFREFQQNMFVTTSDPDPRAWLDSYWQGGLDNAGDEIPILRKNGYLRAWRVPDDYKPYDGINEKNKPIKPAFIRRNTVIELAGATTNYKRDQMLAMAEAGGFSTADLPRKILRFWTIVNFGEPGTFQCNIFPPGNLRRPKKDDTDACSRSQEWPQDLSRDLRIALGNPKFQNRRHVYKRAHISVGEAEIIDSLFNFARILCKLPESQWDHVPIQL